MQVDFAPAADLSARSELWLLWLRAAFQQLTTTTATTADATAPTETWVRAIVVVHDARTQTQIQITVLRARDGVELNRFGFGTARAPIDAESGARNFVCDMIERGALGALARYAQTIPLVAARAEQAAATFVAAQ